MELFRDDLEYDKHHQRRNKYRGADEIAVRVRLGRRLSKPGHGYAIAAGFTKRSRENLDDPEGESDGWNFARRCQMPIHRFLALCAGMASQAEARMSTQQMPETAPGDRVTDSGPGYVGGALVFDAALATVAAAWFWIGVSRVTLIWMAFILTPPLGATAVRRKLTVGVQMPEPDWSLRARGRAHSGRRICQEWFARRRGGAGETRVHNETVRAVRS